MPGIILVRGRTDTNGAVILGAEPGPAGSEPGQGGLFEFLFEIVQVAECGIDRSRQITTGGTSAVRTHAFPEHRVVQVTASVVANRAANIFGDVVKAADQLADRLFLEFGIAGDGVVQVGDVSGMMFAVMDLHRRRVDVRFERIVGIR